MSERSQVKPRVSIGMPVYNGGQFLRQAIDSILAQTFTDFELIISDNASTDSTLEICREYAARDPRIRLVANPVNQGAAWNHAHVVELAKADYFTWAHSDDHRAPTNIERCFAELDRAPSSVIVALTQGIIIDENEKPTDIKIPSMDIRQVQPSKRLHCAIQNAVWCNVIFGLMRTSVLRACRPLGGYAGSDLVLIYELAIRGQLLEIPEKLFFRRWHVPWSDAYTASYMDPRGSHAMVNPQRQIILNAMRTVRATGLPWLESMRCYAMLLREWVPPYWRDTRRGMKRAFKSRIRRMIGKSPTPANTTSPEGNHQT